jgi:hypothetical protein
MRWAATIGNIPTTEASTIVFTIAKGPHKLLKINWIQTIGSAPLGLLSTGSRGCSAIVTTTSSLGALSLMLFRPAADWAGFAPV